MNVSLNEYIDKINGLGKIIAHCGKTLNLPGQSRNYGCYKKKDNVYSIDNSSASSTSSFPSDVFTGSNTQRRSKQARSFSHLPSLLLAIVFN